MTYWMQIASGFLHPSSFSCQIYVESHLSSTQPQLLPPMLTDELEFQVEPAAVVAIRKSHKEVLIHWKDLSNFSAATL